MKKIVFILFLIIILLVNNNTKSYIIPEEAIRFRIIANSNELNDQLEKSIIKNDVEEKLREILSDVNNYDDANTVLTKNIAKIEEVVKNKSDNYNIKLGLNYFPEKKYKGVVYPKGLYNSLVITLGNGLGENWWCVLYPPLCFIDESKIDDNQYSFFIKDLFNKIK